MQQLPSVCLIPSGKLPHYLWQHPSFLLTERLAIYPFLGRNAELVDCNIAGLWDFKWHWERTGFGGVTKLNINTACLTINELWWLWERWLGAYNSLRPIVPKSLKVIGQQLVSAGARPMVDIKSLYWFFIFMPCLCLSHLTLQVAWKGMYRQRWIYL